MPIMSRRLDEDDEDLFPARRSTAEREMTLGTGAILGIFFGLVLLLGAFFGFGYKLGSSTSKSAIPADAPEASAPSPASKSFGAFKPSAGSPLASNGAVAVRDGGVPVITAPPGAPVRPAQSAAVPPTPESEPVTLAASQAPPHPLSSLPAPAAAVSTLPAAPLPSPSANGTFVVQVAAVSHQEDADLLVNALHARGYAVAARTEPGDRLVHIQVGPFRSKTDAEAMKARLTGDGYNAYIK